MFTWLERIAARSLRPCATDTAMQCYGVSQAYYQAIIANTDAWMRGEISRQERDRRDLSADEREREKSMGTSFPDREISDMLRRRGETDPDARRYLALLVACQEVCAESGGIIDALSAAKDPLAVPAQFLDAALRDLIPATYRACADDPDDVQCLQAYLPQEEEHAMRYRDPLGLPLRWQDEQSGRLVEVVHAYFERKPLTASQIALIRTYLRYFIHAPCWNLGGPQETVACLKLAIRAITTQTELDDWIQQCLSIGIDPL